MMTATALPSVDSALNLVIAEENNKMERSRREQNNGQFLFGDEIDKEKLGLNDEPTVPEWTTKGYNMEKFPNVSPVPKAAAVDFTKIETLISKPTTAISIEEPKPEVQSTSEPSESESKPSIAEVEELDMPKERVSLLKQLKIEDVIYGNIVITEVTNKSNTANLQLRNKKKLHSLNSSARVKKSPSSLSGKKSKRSKQNGISKNRDFKAGKQKKPTPKAKKKDITPEPHRSPSASPLRSLTPSLDPELLRQFEEEDRPKRVLRSSTIAAGMPKAPAAISNNKSATIGNSFGSEKKKVTRKSTTKKPGRKPKKQRLPSIVAYPFPSPSVFNLEQSGRGRKRRRLQSEGDAGKKQPRKRLKTELDALIDQDFVVLLDNLKNTGQQQENEELQRRRGSAGSMSRASTSSASTGSVSVAHKILPGKRSRGRRSSRVETINFKSNWKLIKPLKELQTIYIDNDIILTQRQRCYKQAQNLRTGDFLTLYSNVRVNSIDGEPNYGRIARLYYDPTTGIPTATVMWFYSPRQVKLDGVSVSPPVAERELLASRHIDTVPLDAVDEIVWVLTANEYARFMAESMNDAYPRAQRVREEDLLWRKGEDNYRRRFILPYDDSPFQSVFFCRRVYGFKQHKVTTNKPVTLCKSSHRKMN